MVDTGKTITSQQPTVSGNFTDLRKSIADAVDASVPKDKHGVVFAIVGTDGVRFGAAARVGDRWQITGDLSTDGHGKHVTGRVMVAGEW